jgi:hypothetical protein
VTLPLSYSRLPASLLRKFPVLTLIQAKARIYGYSRLPQGLKPLFCDSTRHGDLRLKPWATNHALPNLELTERLELSTSPLPRECSTTELRQHFHTKNLNHSAKTFYSSILPRTQPSEYDTKGKKT